MMKLYLNLRTTAISVAMATIFLLAGSAGSSAQDIVKVKADGQAFIDDQNHLTWNSATSELQAAIDDLAASGGGEIWVAGGTYLPTLHFSANPDIEDQLGTNPSDRYLSFVIRENVTVRGGFMGHETDISERPDELFQAGNTTILSGDIGATNDSTDNSYHVAIFPQGTSSLAILDGFLITGGNADNGVDFDGRGGGIHAREGGYVINCQIINNNAGARGGGAYLYKGGTINNSAISENQAGIEGGGIFLNQGGEVTHSAIYSNACVSATEGNGGGVFLNSDSGLRGSVTYSIITANHSANKGGGAGIYEETTDQSYPGGKLINNLIANNEATGNGGGVHTQNAGYLLNNTIVRNQSDGGGAVYSNNGGEIINSVLWGNTTTSYPENPQFQTGGTTSATADYCAIENGTEGTNITNLVSLEPDNEGTTGLYPYFSNPTSFSGQPQDGTQEDELANSDYSIMSLASALIDTGAPNTLTDEFNGTDLAGDPRFTKSAIDIGAYEALYHTVITEVTNGTGGTLTPEQPTDVMNGENIQFTLTPADNNEVISFTINGTDYKDQLTEETNSFVYTMSVTEELDAVAEFGIPSSVPDAARKDILIYPNPADQQLFIEGITIRKLNIHSLNGQTIMSLQNPSSRIDVSTLQKGLYFIEIEDNDQQKHIMKFIKK